MSLVKAYWVDRTITRLLQRLAARIEQYIGITRPETYRIIIFIASSFGLFASFAVVMISALGIRPIPAGVMVLMVFSLSALNYCTIPLARLWRMAHCWLDRPQALSMSKLYTDGYAAWSCCLMAAMVGIGVVICPVLGLRLSLAASFVILAMIAYADFITRIKLRDDDAERCTSEAKESLLQRCRQWLSPPASAPGSVGA
jgi:hypothetical protein